MTVPYMAQTLNGWTTKTDVKVVTQSVVNHKTVEVEADATLDINRQPMPAQQVDRKPEGQRQWKWWSLIVRNGQLLNIDDKITISNITYKIMKVNNWTESGFQKYEAIEDYT